MARGVECDKMIWGRFSRPRISPDKNQKANNTWFMNSGKQRHLAALKRYLIIIQKNFYPGCKIKTKKSDTIFLYLGPDKDCFLRILGTRGKNNPDDFLLVE